MIRIGGEIKASLSFLDCEIKQSSSCCISIVPTKCNFVFELSEDVKDKKNREFSFLVFDQDKTELWGVLLNKNEPQSWACIFSSNPKDSPLLSCPKGIDV